MARSVSAPAKQLGARIKAARDESDITQNELASALDKGRKTIQRWENGQSEPNPTILLRIATETSVSPLWLLTGEGPMGAGEASEVPQLAGEFVLPEEIEGEKGIPILDLFARAGREGGFVASEEPIGFLRPDENSPFYQLDNGHAKAYILPIRGNSMEPTLRRGQLVPVRRFSRPAEDIREDDIYVFRYEEEIFVKRLQKIRGRTIRVISDNERYDTLEITLDEGTDFEVLGQVLV